MKTFPQYNCTHAQRKSKREENVLGLIFFACTQFFNEIVQPLIWNEREENLAKCCKTLYLLYRHLIFKRKKLYIFSLSLLVVCFVFSPLCLHEKIISRMKPSFFIQWKLQCVNGIDSTSWGTLSFNCFIWGARCRLVVEKFHYFLAYSYRL